MSSSLKGECSKAVSHLLVNSFLLYKGVQSQCQPLEEKEEEGQDSAKLEETDIRRS